MNRLIRTINTQRPPVRPNTTFLTINISRRFVTFLGQRTQNRRHYQRVCHTSHQRRWSTRVLTIVIPHARRLRTTELNMQYSLLSTRLHTTTACLAGPPRRNGTPALTNDVFSTSRFANLRLNKRHIQPNRTVATKTIVSRQRHMNQRVLITIINLIVIIVLRIQMFSFLMERRHIEIFLQHNIRNITPIIFPNNNQNYHNGLHTATNKIFRSITRQTLPTRVRIRHARTSARIRHTVASNTLGATLNHLTPHNIRILRHIRVRPH